MTTEPKITIDPEFKALCPPLTDEERAGLEQSLLDEGCRDALVLWGDILIDGHNRYAICQRHGIEYQTVHREFEDRKAARIWIRSNQLSRRNLTDGWKWELTKGNREEYAAEGKKTQGTRTDLFPQNGKKSPDPTPGHNTHEALANDLGWSKGKVHQADYIDRNADPDTKAKWRDGEKSTAAAYRQTKQKREQAARDEKRREAAAAVPEREPDERIIVGDFAENRDAVPDGSLCLIYTDPPYNRGAEQSLRDLSVFASEKLASGGSLICYVGQTQLPLALDVFRENLRYWWIIACLHQDQKTTMREYGITSGWKAMLWFVKDKRHDDTVMVNDFVSTPKEKTFHEWQQNASEAKYWIEKLCPADGIVCDPFLGSGTTAVAAQELQRQWIGFEIDADTAKIAEGRIHDA